MDHRPSVASALGLTALRAATLYWSAIGLTCSRVPSMFTWFHHLTCYIHGSYKAHNKWFKAYGKRDTYLETLPHQREASCSFTYSSGMNLFLTDGIRMGRTRDLGFVQECSGKGKLRVHTVQHAETQQGKSVLKANSEASLAVPQPSITP